MTMASRLCVTTIDEIRLATTPMPSVMAKPWTCGGPMKPRITHVINVEVFESRIAGHARRLFQNRDDQYVDLARTDGGR